MGIDRKGEGKLDIYTYAFVAYGLTAVIAFMTMGLILLINKVITRI